ncbi:hypothetical protein PQQ52_17840 [Paraburkholderia sediminicola]|uniref:hypothetical protein n=1 Tax=Paraburkholderia sediminicola TaxID=458836 RepID=UPI0038B703C0
MNRPVNLASLPKDDALARARAGGRTIFGDDDAVSHVYTDLMSRWIGRNLPKAVGQSDDEFGDLVEEIEKEFNAGVVEAVVAARARDKSRAILDRIDELATEQSLFAFKLQGLVAFMVEALPDDLRGELPVKFTLTQLRDDMMQLAENVMDLAHGVKNG